MHIDARRLSSGSRLDVDVCIVGAGPAGIALALRLSGNGLRVGVIEAGGFRPTVRDQAMLADATSGTPYWKLQNVRVRMVGGSGNRWGGICRPLDPIDFAERAWVEHSGWPIDHVAMVPYYEQAGRFLVLPDTDFDDPPPGVVVPPVPVDCDLEQVNYRISPNVAFGKAFAGKLRDSTDVTVVTRANVVGIERSADGSHVTGLRIRSHNGVEARVGASRFVLATGGIENARLLLANDLGNEHDTVGRYFMEHVHAPIAHLVPSAETVDWSSYIHSTEQLLKLGSALAPKPDVQRVAGLLTASIAVGPTWYSARPPFADWDYRMTVPAEWLFTVMSAGDGRLSRLAAASLDRGRALWNSLSSRDIREGLPAGSRTVYYRGEQAPHPDNRVVLGDDFDSLGQRRARLLWSVGKRELDNASEVLERFAAVVRDNGWGTVVGPHVDWTDRIVGGPHHMGTTRMSSDPNDGVVDADCRVHTSDNLYVTGSSVFTTGGHANPTLTVIALSLRLGDHLLAPTHAAD